jgi:plasmid stabilization system protein ParE
MAYKAIATRAFERDLNRILSYYSALPNAADELTVELEKAISVLIEMPELNAPMRFVSDSGRKYRRHLVKRYLVVYRVEGDVVYFARLFHQSQDYERYLGV